MVAKACKVLRAFSPNVGVLSVRQVAERAQVPRSTAHELCRTLVAEGLLEVVDDGYRLGPLLLELAGQLIVRTGIVRASEGILERLAQLPEREAYLGHLSSGWIFVFEKASSGRKVPMHKLVGQRVPAHLTGCGKAALSWLPFDAVVSRVQMCCAEDSLPLPNFDEFEQELRIARENGCVVSQDEPSGPLSVAAPILDALTEPLGGIALAGPASMFSSAALAATRESVIDAAGLVSSRLITSRAALRMTQHHDDPRP